MKVSNLSEMINKLAWMMESGVAPHLFVQVEIDFKLEKRLDWLICS